MTAFCNKAERFFLVFLWINPFLDILSGGWLLASEKAALPSVTPSLVIRMAVFALFALYLLLDRAKTEIALLLPAALAFVLTAACEWAKWGLSGFSLPQELVYAARFAFNLTALLVYLRVFRKCGKSREELLVLLRRALLFCGAVLACGVLLPFLFGFGNFHGDRFGMRGTLGIFYSGNDITAVLMMLLPPSLACVLTDKSRRIACLVPALLLLALLMISTKTAYLAVAAALLGALVCALFSRKAYPHAMMRLLTVLAVTVLLFALLTAATGGSAWTVLTRSLTHTGTVAEQSGAVNAIFSGRQTKLKNALMQWKEQLPLSALFGIGRGTQEKVIEMDLCEVGLYYGVFGFVTLLWMYFLCGFRLLGRAFRKPEVSLLSVLLSLALAAAFCVLAGHVLFSVTSGFYFALLLACGTLLTAESVESVRIFRK